jgi:RimJ/RimL family protein N-acetyltransferase
MNFKKDLNMKKSKIDFELRKFSEKDINSIIKYANNENIAKWLSNEFPHPYSAKDAKTFIDIVSNEYPTKTFTIDIDGKACGSIAVNPIEEKNKGDTPMTICDKQGELGYWLAEDYWNQGIISSAIEKIVEYGFETLNIDCIFATPFIKNTASQKVLKKAGFKTDSKKRKIIKNNWLYEVIIFSINKTD